MNKDHDMVSVSGGKDSTALLLLAIERETEGLWELFCIKTGTAGPCADGDE